MMNPFMMELIQYACLVIPNSILFLIYLECQKLLLFSSHQAWTSWQLYQALTRRIFEDVSIYTHSGTVISGKSRLSRPNPAISASQNSSSESNSLKELVEGICWYSHVDVRSIADKPQEHRPVQCMTQKENKKKKQSWR